MLRFFCFQHLGTYSERGAWVFLFVYMVGRGKGVEGIRKRDEGLVIIFLSVLESVFVFYLHGMEIYLIATCTLTCHD